LVNEFGVFKANSVDQAQRRAADHIQEFLLKYSKDVKLSPKEANDKAWKIVDSSIVEAYRPSVMGIFKHQSTRIVRFFYGNLLRRNLRPLSHRAQTTHESQTYWRNPASPGNVPKGYLDAGKTAHTKLRSQFLLRTIQELGLAKSSRILEIGCSSGRNLHYLFMDGYANLHGIEINESAIALFRETYSGAANHAKIRIAAIEDAIPTLESKSFDVVFTMDTLEVLHKESDWIFPHIARVTRKILITVENESGRGLIYTPRNYRAIFEGLGAKQIKEVHCSDQEGYPRQLMDPSDHIVARVFTVEPQ
jgi:SAM-dependent methyltransferase